MLDISALNAFICYTALNPNYNINKKNYRRRLFLIEVGNALVEPFIAQRSRAPRGHNTSRIYYQIRGESTSENLPSNGLSTSTLQHQPTTRKRVRCYICPNKSYSNAYTIRCDKCTNSICPNHCFNLCENCGQYFK